MLVLQKHISLIPNCPSMKKPLSLKDVPMDILKFILKAQFEIKSNKCIKQYSLEQTIYKLLREHKSFPEKKS